ncbi:hypothetical protein BD311DRAFT_659140 [Dichomitus squalens]|uniref:Protein kinase domain-containing protein n=1 Tax=Dichomitus squalens TaxID=114155 RepID=A0A4Q9MRK3_9APHY|nr:hypothetical protein BD311DRAFT_659140 [Dichomitus squalens]
MYKRYFPSPEEPKGNGEEETAESEATPSLKENVAHLYLRKKNRFGSGNHSFVYRAPLTLPPPLSGRSPTGQVTVAAKLAYSRCTAHELLHNEARVYDTLPKHLQEDWCGYNVVPQCRFPVPVGAITPKFFGFYLPVDKEGKFMMKRHAGCSEDEPHAVEWASPILLMEECGTPVEPAEFTADQRTECFSLILRLHHMDIVQGSFYIRNIMCQPGPLTLPPDKRSYDHPSFRIIDFGRGKCWDWELEALTGAKHMSDKSKAEARDRRRLEFRRRISDEVARARKELLVMDFGF